MNPFIRIWKWLEPPNPVELGRSEELALPMRDFPGGHGEDPYTWEDWEDEVRKSHPVRFWITRTAMYNYWYPVRRRVVDAWYWVQCRILPGRNYHILDLRNPAPDIKYTHGWRDMPEVMLWSPFLILRKFVEGEEPVDPATWMTVEQLAENHQQKASHDEIMALYHWWMHGRVEEEAEENRLYEATKQVERNSSEYATAMDAWVAYRTWRENVRENEMLHRLIEVRPRLWT